MANRRTKAASQEERPYVDYKKRIRKRRRRRKIALVFLLCIGVVCFFRFAPFFRVTKVICEGNSQVAEEEILKAAAMKENQNLFAYSSSGAEKRIRKIPYINEAVISKRLPGTVRISVNERSRAAYIPYADLYYVIDRWGRILQVDVTPPEDLILVYGVKPTVIDISSKVAFEQPETQDIMLEVFDRLITAGLMEQTTFLDLADLQEISFHLGDRLVVNLGEYTDFERKFSLVTRSLELEPEAEGRFDVSDGARVVYSKKPAEVEPTPPPEGTAESGEKPAQTEGNLSATEEHEEE